ncbi:MAG: hypothetical protein US45_C0061G0007 [Candidatus Nomurabacteria bacterium GW2011_GWA1_37_20]|uniref:Uncharacterized protein n=1 Tax=Candidatus Nomurabacteria bacterium GW2011_GWA1_37_20 TaxID=1618729 RepID=A0A0G0GE25_9BACT|nr:MAG: hypothetical protein US33_C0039G0009 [Parcubacteria group bacterium GW2011_GWC1_36_9]KKQ25499.1 MAG: hypothetical protein US41_C0043G0009 [Parcubacteria group bacterium GW2011_GWB1_37_13]KKQ29383.1 MAG: hypothetical protein US45_C0061G0007 [Candidatus Nomurabacteria bacterium GW2011_GWA1_37_20]
MIKRKDKTITNIELLKSINRSFSNIEKKMATKDDIKDMATKTDVERLEKRIDDFAETKVSKVTFKELENRVQKIEAKI